MTPENMTVMWFIHEHAGGLGFLILCLGYFFAQAWGSRGGKNG